MQPIARIVDESPADLRRAIRAGRFRGPTSGRAPGYLQGNLAILPRAHAQDFLAFCVANPKPCPLIGVSEPGESRVPSLGADLDLATDVGAYRVFRGGPDYERVADLGGVWRDDLVGFVIGCSFSFEESLSRARIPVRHIEAGRNVPMYVTNLETRRAGPFGGPMVVSMRAFSPADAIRAIVLSERQPLAHGAPVHFGDPARIGIADLMRPDFGDPPVLAPGDVPVFWACGVTPQIAIREARPDLAVTHEPGHMLVTDKPAEGASIGP
ncbi:putative hydro-lyase [Salinarimonas rosea]|uniref:putative hydro-lyase n=1 Tax=Salinarimonas rosea TaxID=552063 RepID=UPI00041840A3|nr:putative hydro-lyase [Salinarimonas rosea]